MGEIDLEQFYFQPDPLNTQDSLVMNAKQPKQPTPGREDRQRRLMGPILDVFDHLHGRGWVTLAGVVILIILIAMSFLPQG